MSEKIRVLIVDDSALVRQSLKEILGDDPAIEVIGEARDGKEGYEKAKLLRPGVITMDLTMPVMGGLDAIEAIMEEVPTPIIVVSSMEVKVIVQALALGAMDFVAVAQEIDVLKGEILEKVKIASRVRALRRIRVHHAPKKVPVRRSSANKAIAIGVSTGGPQALQVLLSKFPADLPAAVLVVQHIAPGFVQGLVDWLSLTSPMHIHLAKAGDALHNGTVLFAPDGYHMVVDAGEKIGLKEDITHKMLHVPSIDVMMMSVAEVYGDAAVGVIMTGMGKDGVEGISTIKDRGGYTLAQDEKTSVIYGMNKAAVERGIIDKVLPLEEIAGTIAALVTD